MTEVVVISKSTFCCGISAVHIRTKIL